MFALVVHTLIQSSARNVAFGGPLRAEGEGALQHILNARHVKQSKLVCMAETILQLRTFCE